MNIGPNFFPPFSATSNEFSCKFSGLSLYDTYLFHNLSMFWIFRILDKEGECTICSMFIWALKTLLCYYYYFFFCLYLISVNCGFLFYIYVTPCIFLMENLRTLLSSVCCFLINRLSSICRAIIYLCDFFKKKKR